jgi:transcriptional regulator with XRE-family HTH domain
MNDLSKLMEEIVSQDEELQKEVDLLKLKYDIIDELVSYRKMNKMTQSEFANKANVKQQMISRFEKGDVDPRLSFVSKILFAMKKEVLIRDTDYIPVKNLIDFTNYKQRISTPNMFSSYELTS